MTKTTMLPETHPAVGPADDSVGQNCGVRKASALDRRQFLTASGGLLLAFTLNSASRAAQIHGGPIVPDPGVRRFPVETNVNAWIRIATDESITVLIGSAEMGQGVYSGLSQIAAEELRVDWQKVSAMPLSFRQRLGYGWKHQHSKQLSEVSAGRCDRPRNADRRGSKSLERFAQRLQSRSRRRRQYRDERVIELRQTGAPRRSNAGSAQSSPLGARRFSADRKIAAANRLAGENGRQREIRHRHLPPRHGLRCHQEQSGSWRNASLDPFGARRGFGGRAARQRGGRRRVEHLAGDAGGGSDVRQLEHSCLLSKRDQQRDFGASAAVDGVGRSGRCGAGRKRLRRTRQRGPCVGHDLFVPLFGARLHGSPELHRSVDGDGVRHLGADASAGLGSSLRRGDYGPTGFEHQCSCDLAWRRPRTQDRAGLHRTGDTSRQGDRQAGQADMVARGGYGPRSVPPHGFDQRESGAGCGGKCRRMVEPHRFAVDPLSTKLDSQRGAGHSSDGRSDGTALRPGQPSRGIRAPSVERSGRILALRRAFVQRLRRRVRDRRSCACDGRRSAGFPSTPAFAQPGSACAPQPGGSERRRRTGGLGFRLASGACSRNRLRLVVRQPGRAGGRGIAARGRFAHRPQGRLRDRLRLGHQSGFGRSADAGRHFSWLERHSLGAGELHERAGERAQFQQLPHDAYERGPCDIRPNHSKRAGR